MASLAGTAIDDWRNADLKEGEGQKTTEFGIKVLRVVLDPGNEWVGMAAATPLPTSTLDPPRCHTSKLSHAGLNAPNRNPADRRDQSCRYALGLHHVESN